MTENIKTAEPFTQVCVWPGTICGPEQIASFEEFFLTQMNTRIKYLEEVLTLPDFENGRVVADTGGRNDIFFAVHSEDIPRFAVPRLTMGIRWIEDVLDNEKHHGNGSIYHERVIAYRTW